MDFDFNNIKGAVFDFDGTVTDKGVPFPPQEMIDGLLELSKRVPIAFCTGRQLESFLDHGLQPILHKMGADDQKVFMGNLYLMAENGSVGYKLNPKIYEFEEFYRVDWPSEFVDKEEFKLRLAKAVKDYGNIYYNAHRVVLVIRTIFDRELGKSIDFDNVPDWDIEKVYEYSGKIYDAVVQLLKEIGNENGLDYRKYLHVGNAGIGVLVVPANGDKDNGVKMFVEHLKNDKEEEVGNMAREILVVGDSHQSGGNDEYLLNGKLGTCYTVGEGDIISDWPKVVLDSSGNRLYNYRGTLALVDEILGKF